MNSEINNILKKVDNTDFFKNYTEFKLSKSIDMSQQNMKNLIVELNNKPNMKAYYNYRTLNCDTIGVVDMDNNRIIDFDDNYFILMNKGIECHIDKVNDNNNTL